MPHVAFHTFPVPEFSSPAFSSLAFSAPPNILRTPPEDEVAKRGIANFGKTAVVSASLSISIIERKRSWNRVVAYPMYRSVSLYVGLSVWKMYCGKTAYWGGGEWSRSMDGCIR